MSKRVVAQVWQKDQKETAWLIPPPNFMTSVMLPIWVELLDRLAGPVNEKLREDE